MEEIDGFLMSSCTLFGIVFRGEVVNFARVGVYGFLGRNLGGLVDQRTTLSAGSVFDTEYVTYCGRNIDRLNVRFVSGAFFLLRIFYEEWYERGVPKVIRRNESFVSTGVVCFPVVGDDNDEGVVPSVGLLKRGLELTEDGVGQAHLENVCGTLDAYEIVRRDAVFFWDVVETSGG